MSREPQIVAELEDEPVVWYAASASPWAVRRRCASSSASEWRTGAGWVIASWRIRITLEHLRRASTADCPAAVHAVDDPQRLDSRSHDCRCGEIVDEGYFLDCRPDHPDAIAVWRCEPSHPPLWWIEFRRWQHSIGAKRRGRPVLWGGRVDREATWLDRVVFGGGFCQLLKGDRYYRLGETELRHCAACGRITPHHRRYGGGMACHGPLHDAGWFDAHFPARSTADGAA